MMLLPSLISFGLLVSVSAGPLLFQPHDQLSVSKQTCKSGLECQENDTCCEVKSGGWSCCPFKNAACCKDKLHCCPGGTQCNLTSQHCEKPNQVYPIRLISLSKDTKVKSIVCPDKKSDCPDGSTCCRLASGDYGCCPLPDATCCSDNVHCCPRGYTCDVQSGSCDKGLISVLWVKKIPAKTKNVQCPDGKTECPGNNTCCLHGPGRYGCCPLMNAVCCPDYVHCCPQDFTCLRASQSCSNGTASYPWTKQNPPIRSITCPDGSSSCPAGSTCCQFASGQYGCCPFPNATCCSDHIHCCPDGYTCHPSEGTCSKNTMLIPMAEVVQHKIFCRDGTSCQFGAHCCQVGESEYKCCPAGHWCSDKECQKYQPSLTLPTVVIHRTDTIVKGVHCPDGKLVCPDDTTCCQMSTGAYGCCPMPDANCCPDHIHCCPHDQKCDIKSGACVNGHKTFPLLKKFAAKFADVVCPDGKGTCPTGSTCCKLASGKYGCCPLLNATCCDDHVHCCPNGYTCDTAHSTCNKGALFVPMAKKTPAKSVVTETLPGSNIICPDRETVCDESSTCCKLKSGDYGCCPFKKAICCTDREHCCPEGYHCDREKEACLRSPLPMLKQSLSVSVVVCPNKQTCPNSNTCCRLASGGYGCCPRPNAVCCADHTHCCPSGYTCNLKAGTCTKGALSLPWLEKTEAKVKDVVCPDGSSTCPDNNTCCKLASGQYGCCPLPRATCCSDHTHCCPEGYTCHPSEGTCTKGTVSIPWMKKTSGIRQVKRVICPDGSSCPNDNTCCIASGQYECCPMPRATCCSDHTGHCCPQGYMCHPSEGTCSKGTVSIPWLEKTSAIKNLKNVISTIKKRQCPGGVMCPSDHSTCCPDQQGRYRCCRHEHATCCKDGLHCCPEGEKCYSMPNGDVTCIPKSLKEVGDVKARVGYIMCPGRVYQCPDGNSCCKTATGAYSCCPLPHAVCCPDYLHCCPNGYTCAGQGQCRKEGEETIAWMTKRPALRTRSQDIQEPARQLLQTLPKGKSTLVSNVVCPDGASQCPDGNTCCKLASGQYGCCPLPNAECCSDHVHCCPNGYTCDVSAGTCSKGASTLKWLQKSTASTISVNGVVCPDGASECPNGNTCCKLASGQYGCCPLPQAVCCSDHVHCCPNGYTCDVSSGKCNKGLESIPWVGTTVATESVGLSVLAKVSSKISVRSVLCPDKQGTCPDGNTCCLLASGRYGCCPLPQATCCSDHTHCCPHGTTCDTAAGTCNKGDLSLPWYEKAPATPVGSVVCPDGASQCPNGNTCCKLASSQYGCCPLPNAECCSDHVHCCPNGYTCDVSAGTCSKGVSTLKLLPKSPATPLNGVVCPDGASECPSGNTCCKLASGQYGCCPLPNAECCSDHVHCCPNGYSCDVSAGTCSKGALSLPWVNKIASMKKTGRASLSAVICPDGASECPNGNTCCPMQGGSYGCCPLPMAVCCSDMLHCCPNGYTCDVGAGTCLRAGKVITWFTNMTKTEAKVKNVICPGGGATCPNDNTCCRLASGQYGCCPLPRATCCSDHTHCCPEGYMCHPSEGTCSKSPVSLPWVTHELAGSSIICPDKQGTCPDGNTCCLLASGKYGCCPLPQATCCSDHTHCCPHGTTCDTAAGTCNQGTLLLPWLEKIATTPLNGVVCPDGASECPNGNTCCKLASGQYGCCPLPQAVCCSDHVHCCPNGYTCDVSSGKCNKSFQSIPWVKKSFAKNIPEPFYEF